MTAGTSVVHLAIALRVETGGRTYDPPGTVTTQVIAEMAYLYATAKDLMVGPRPGDLVPRHPTAAFLRKLACMPVPTPPATGRWPAPILSFDGP